MKVEFFLNDKKVVANIENEEFLLDTLKKLGVTSIRRGCDTSCCGLCTVWVNNSPILSCTFLSIRIDGKNVTTIDGIAGEANKFAQILVSEGSDQCGFCSPGFIMTVIALKKELTNPTDEQIKEYLLGNLCRCTGYLGQMRAIKKYLEDN